ncbi:MAG: methyltransferase domain-containing protein [Alphaproteobacteria bacterium]|nr:methyltransferase domain-containing protein [Alphaproteobacteria bacterium]MDX5368192.1 methyltransferase domain-containing protein [Alphaproteobacteria bacterium]MDX5463008.1 methyltransferase domain-containing protein [Alphaproteobacteria bacterium]
MSGAMAWSPEDYAANARFVSDLAAPLVDLLDPKPGERILDIGCGDGVLTQKIVARGAEVLGLDASPDMVAATRALGIPAEIGNAMELAFEGQFDAVFSNAALHWMPDARAVVQGVSRALKPGGRFVGEFGGKGNVAAIETAIRAILKARGLGKGLPNPWYFPTPEEYAELLESEGFTVRDIALIPRPTPVVAGMARWLDTLAAPLLSGLDAQERAAVRDEAVDLLTPVLRDSKGQWRADYVRLRFHASLG